MLTVVAFAVGMSSEQRVDLPALYIIAALVNLRGGVWGRRAIASALDAGWA